MELLNKSWSYTLKPSFRAENTVIDIGAIKFMASDVREVIREAQIVKRLEEKPVYYLKADKGNSIVIMDKK